MTHEAPVDLGTVDSPEKRVQHLERIAHNAEELAMALDFIADQETDPEATRVHGIATAIREGEQVALRAAGSITPKGN